MKIGWIGTGILGSAILQRLSDKFDLIAWNRTSSKVDKLSKYGIQKANSLKELSITSEIVFLCVKGEDTYNEILFDQENGLIKYLKPKTLVVDTSTINPSTSIFLNDTLRYYDLRYVECPVSGGPEGALTGRLTAILAGEYQDIEEARTIIKHFCSPIHFVGDIGKAQLIKILNNLAESINLLGAAEVISIGMALGIDLDILHNVLSTTRGNSVYMEVLFDRLLNPKQDVSASLDVRLKDIKLANLIASEYNLPIPLGFIAKELFEMAIGICGDNADQTECINIYKK